MSLLGTDPFLKPTSNTAELNDVTKGIAAILKRLGFKKNGLRWHRVTNELIHAVSLQRSQWGEQYYLNIGILIRQLDNRVRPRTSECQILGRLAMFLSASDASKFIIDLEKPTPENNLPTTLEALQSVVSFLSKNVNSLFELRSYLRKHSGLLVTADAKTFLRQKLHVI